MRSPIEDLFDGIILKLGKLCCALRCALRAGDADNTEYRNQQTHQRCVTKSRAHIKHISLFWFPCL